MASDPEEKNGQGGQGRHRTIDHASDGAVAQPGPQAHATLPTVVVSSTQNNLLADDLPLMTWLQQHIWPVEAAVIGPEFVADGTTLAIAEMLRGGTTCANENYFFPDVQAAVYKRHGFRARVGLPVIDFPTAWAASDDEYFDKADEVHDQWRDDALIATAFAPHAPYTVNDANFERVRMLADSLSQWDKEITPNAVEIYVSRLRAKLAGSRVGIRTVRGIGYRLTGEV